MRQQEMKKSKQEDKVFADSEGRKLELDDIARAKHFMKLKDY